MNLYRTFNRKLVIGVDVCCRIAVVIPRDLSNVVESTTEGCIYGYRIQGEPQKLHYGRLDVYTVAKEGGLWGYCKSTRDINYKLLEIYTPV